VQHDAVPCVCTKLAGAPGPSCRTTADRIGPEQALLARNKLGPEHRIESCKRQRRERRQTEYREPAIALPVTALLRAKASAVVLSCRVVIGPPRAAGRRVVAALHMDQMTDGRDERYDGTSDHAA
jgi:hypothetical protein